MRLAIAGSILGGFSPLEQLCELDELELDAACACVEDDESTGSAVIALCPNGWSSSAVSIHASFPRAVNIRL